MIDSSPQRYLGLTSAVLAKPISIGGVSTRPRGMSWSVGAILHAAACSLARVDGKSPVEYLDAEEQAIARSFAARPFSPGRRPGTICA